MSSGKVILNYGDSLIRASDMVILETNQWLNDAIIGFYFEYLGNESKTVSTTGTGHLEFYGPGIAQLIKLLPNAQETECILGQIPDTIQYGFWPVNDSDAIEVGSSGSHWSLLVFSRPDNKFMHFDSYGGSNQAAAYKLFQRLRPLFSSTASFYPFDQCCAQSNGRDCGLHVIMNAKIIQEFIFSKISKKECPQTLLCNNGLSTATPKQAETMRSELLELIKSLQTTG